MRIVCLSLLVGLLTAARAGAGEPMEVRYGHVIDKRPLQEGSSVPKGAIIGGIVGLATASGKSGSTKVKRTAGGAIIGGVIGNQVDKSRRDWLYTVRFPGGEEQDIVMADERLSLGDCAGVEHGVDATRVHYASDYFCRPQATANTRSEAPQRQTDPCLEARRRLLDAEDPDEIDLLERKIRVICEDG